MLVSNPIAFREVKALRMAIIPPHTRSPAPHDQRSGIDMNFDIASGDNWPMLEDHQPTGVALSGLAAFKEFKPIRRFVQYGMTIANGLFSLFYFSMSRTLQTRSMSVSSKAFAPDDFLRRRTAKALKLHTRGRAGVYFSPGPGLFIHGVRREGAAAVAVS